MSTSNLKHKQADYTSSMNNKLSDAAKCINRSKAEGTGIETVRQCYIKNLKKFSLLTTLYSKRFFVSLSVNFLIFMLVSAIFNSPDTPELGFLIMVNYLILSTLLLRSAMSLFLLNKMEKLEASIDDFCIDVKEFVKNN